MLFGDVINGLKKLYISFPSLKDLPRAPETVCLANEKVEKNFAGFVLSRSRAEGVISSRLRELLEFLWPSSIMNTDFAKDIVDECGDGYRQIYREK
jgi:hypothetical protein